jgi:tRNA(Ile)-lysidine synthetase-like protein
MLLNMSLVTYWLSNDHLWFDANENQDRYISGLFRQGLMKINRLTPLEKVLVYDQFSRHYYRGEYANHITAYFSNKAIDVLKEVGEDAIMELPNNIWVWMMMPFRHIGSYMDIVYVIDACWSKLDSSDDSSRILRRFIKASYRSLDYTITLCKYNGFAFTPQSIKPDPRKYKHILEHIDFKLPIMNSTIDPLYKKFTKSFKEINSPRKMLLMLSGGVDSMVCLHILLQIPNICIEVLHINYCNRGEDSLDEELFLREWCKYNSIDITIKRFYEINRNQCMLTGLRTFYEQYTKDIKFKILCDLDFDSVIMGHNKDDVIENILTNISKKQKFNDLQGMTLTSGIIFRPLLNTTKNEIFDYAHQYKIPYFKNTTPNWSQRGKIRDIIIPSLKCWNPDFTNALEYLAEYVRDIDAMKEDYVQTIMVNNYNSILKELRTTQSFSKHVWKSIMYRVQIPISQASLDHFITKINKSVKTQRVNLTKMDYCIIQHIDNYIIISFKKENK